MKLFYLFSLVTFPCFYAFAQIKNIDKLEKISLKDFEVTSPVVDNNANAVVLLNLGNSEFVGNTNGNFTLVFKQVKRILIKNKNALDLANIKILLYTGNNYQEVEKIENIQATTYNVVNGAIEATKLDNNSIVAEKYDRIFMHQKFALPNVKEGSIIEYSYTINSPFYDHFRSWSFQEKYPTLVSQYHVTIPPMFEYLYLRQGYLKFQVDSVKKTFKTYNMTFSSFDAYRSNDILFFKGDAIELFLGVKDAPGLNDENYIYAEDNFIQKINFFLHAYKISETEKKIITKTWQQFAEKIWKDDDYKVIKDNNGWLKNEIEPAIKLSSPVEQVKYLYEYVRDNYARSGKLSINTTKSPKKTFQDKSGNVADINILLMCMLQKAGFDVRPVFLATKNYGRPYTVTPIFYDYNYVITRVIIDNKPYLLDASERNLGFGKITNDCLNNGGRVIDEQNPILVPLYSDSVVDKTYTSLTFYFDSTKGMLGAFTKNLGEYSSYNLREKLTHQNINDYFDGIKKSYSNEIEAFDFSIDSLKKLDNPVSFQYNLKMKLNNQKVIYLNPLLNTCLKKNPFASTERLYPIEMPSKVDDTYNFSFEIPEGYIVDELPKSFKLSLNETEGGFEYLIQQQDGLIMLRTHLFLKKAIFPPEDYNSLRNFYASVVAKSAQEIVLKKVK